MLEKLKCHRKLISSSFIAAMLFLAAGLFDPYVTVYLLGRGFSKQSITLITALAPLSLIVFPPILGRLSDILGRRRLISVSISVFIISQFFYLKVDHSYLLLIFATLAAYIGFEGASESLLARMEDESKKHRGIITGLFESTKHIGYITGIAVGAYLINLSGVENNLKISICILFFLLIFNNLRKNHNHTSAINLNLVNDIKEFLKIPELRKMAILGYTNNFTTATKTIIVPLLVIESLRADIKFIGLYLGALSVGHLFQFGFGYLGERFSYTKVINIASFIFAIATLGLSFVQNGLQMIGIGLIAGLSLAAWNTNAFAHMSDIGEKHHNEGMVIGAFTSFVSFGSFSGYLLSSVLITITSPRIIVAIFAFVIISGVVVSNIKNLKHDFAE